MGDREKRIRNVRQGDHPGPQHCKKYATGISCGRAVCTIGQACLGLYGTMGMEKETAAAWTP